jgi:hypothetical protein
MTSDRRESLSRVAASGLAFHGFSNAPAATRSSIKAVAFDGFAILDPRRCLGLCRHKARSSARLYKHPVSHTHFHRGDNLNR